MSPGGVMPVSKRRSYADKAGRLAAQLQRAETEVEQLREDLAEAEAMRDHNHTVAERLREEIEGGWLALGFRRNPQNDVFIADGINRLRAIHAERVEALSDG